MSDPATYTRTGHAVWFERPGTVSVREQIVRSPTAGEVMVAAEVSLISPGTELRIFRGQVAPDTELGLETCEGSFAYPVKYGYQVVGRVVEVGANVPLEPGQLVFARHPHQDLFTLRYHPDLIFPLPPSMRPEAAAFSNMMSVAVNALLDIPVRVGDDVAVYGSGPIGLFCAVLAAKTASRVWVVEPSEARRTRAALVTGAVTLHPDQARDAILEGTDGEGVDVAFEASGNPRALQHAMAVLGQEGTLGVVSYYGDQDIKLKLSPEFHFKRLRIVSSQAGMVGSGLQPRWDRERRLRTAWAMLDELPVVDFISHRIDLASATSAYSLLNEGSEDVFGVMFRYFVEGQDGRP